MINTNSTNKVWASPTLHVKSRYNDTKLVDNIQGGHKLLDTFQV